MADITETRLPGVGVRHEFTTDGGERVAVLSHRGGRREIMVYDRDDLDSCTAVLHLSADDTHTLAELLGGAAHVSEAVAAVQQRIEGLAIEWLKVPAGSSAAGKSIGEAGYRSRTGSSIVAVVRGDETIPAPEADFVLGAGDVAVAVGTPVGLDQLRDLLRT